MNKGCYLVVIGMLVVLALFIFLGQLLVNPVIGVEKAVCGLISQTDKTQTEVTEAKCDAVVVSLIPLTRIFLFALSIVVTGVFFIILFTVLGVTAQFT